MQDLLADTLFSLCRYGEETGMSPQLLLEYSKRHLEISEKLNDGSDTKLDDLATSHTSLGQAYLALEDWTSAYEEIQKCKDIICNLDFIKSGEEFPQFANIYQSWALIGLERFDDAAELLLEAIRFRESKFGVDETDSLK